jgi:hypothetical protein
MIQLQGDVLRNPLRANPSVRVLLLDTGSGGADDTHWSGQGLTPIIRDLQYSGCRDYRPIGTIPNINGWLPVILETRGLREEPHGEFDRFVHNVAEVFDLLGVWHVRLGPGGEDASKTFDSID